MTNNRWSNTYSHISKQRELSSNLIDIFRDKRLSVLLQFLLFQSKPQLLNRLCRVDNTVFLHKHYPANKSALARGANKRDKSYIASINGTSLLKLWTAPWLTRSRNS